MSIFKRSKGSPAERDETTEAVETPRPTTRRTATRPARPTAETAAGAPVDRSDGPFDVTEVDGRDGRLDLGALWMRGMPGMELRLEVDQQTQVGQRGDRRRRRLGAPAAGLRRPPLVRSLGRHPR